MAAAEAVTGVRPLRGHYEAYYRHQAAHRLAYRDLYRRFAKVVQDMASARGHGDFTICDLPTRLEIIEVIRDDPATAQEFEIPVFQETLATYARTDAWLALGYVSWEGSARGLEVYRQPFAGSTP